MTTRLLAAVAAGVLLAPAAAQAADKVVTVGPPKPLAKGGAPATADDNAFYPSHIRVKRGQDVKFQIKGFHTVHYVPKGTPAPRFEAPDPTTPLSGYNDAAGTPFHFNGSPRIIVNPEAAAPKGDGVVDGTEEVSSGLDPARTEYAMKFTGKPGNYKVLCTIHRGMELKVTVAARKKAVPSAKQDKKAVKDQYRKAVKLAKRLAGVDPAANTVQLGSDGKTVANFAFFPSKLTVKKGTQVTFAMSKRSTEIHNVLFGPKDLQDQIGASFVAPDTDGALRFNPLAIYPSDAVLPPLTTTVHGNGFLNTAPVAPGQAVKVIAGEAGSYRFVCSLHPFMEATLEVTE